MKKSIMSYLVCDSFHKNLFEVIGDKYTVSMKKDTIVVDIDEGQEIIIFRFGVFVCWNVSSENIRLFREFISPLQVESYDTVLSEELAYEIGSEFKIEYDNITLDEDSQLAKIAISNSLAQNIKLQQFEEYIIATIDENAYIPRQLAQSGKIALGKKDIAKKIGELFIVKNKINLRYDLLDTPDFFWYFPEYEGYYEKISKYLEIKQRVDVLNKKTEVIHELLYMLSNEQNHRYSAFLEWIIIILIAVEIVMGLYGHIVK